LGDQHAERDSAMQRAELATIHEDLQRDDRAGQGEQRSKKNALREAEAQRDGQKRSKGHRAHQLQHSAERADPPDAAQLVDRYLGAQGEHEQRHADLGEDLHRTGGGGRPRRERSDGNPGQKVAQDDRLSQAVRHGSANKCRQHREHQIDQQLQVGHGAMLMTLA
jgi:hypothetical protein